ncbi:hypothetical protein [Umezawaea sp. NPDC059074]|uniref:hypothetical protein n=1 Tax=Umezawaea sp. NPDC059074 TaxID=3346716 RepID=UPI0036BDAE8A
MPVRLPLPVISVGAVAALVGLALGIGLGGTAEHPRGERGAADPSRSGDPERRQSGGDLPPMDFEGRVVSTSPSPSRTTTTTPRASAGPSSTASTSESAPPRSDEVTSAVGVTPTPELPALPSVPEVPVSSLVEAPSSSAPAGP